MKEPKLGPELFYTDQTGKKVDADLHSEMLDGISPKDEARLLEDTKSRAKKYGLTQAHIDALYGQPAGYARGGAAKLTKSAARYHLGTNAEHCGICTMFRHPDSCTAVVGKIRWMDTCKLFERRK